MARAEIGRTRRSWVPSVPSVLYERTQPQIMALFQVFVARSDQKTRFGKISRRYCNGHVANQRHSIPLSKSGARLCWLLQRSIWHNWERDCDGNYSMIIGERLLQNSPSHAFRVMEESTSNAGHCNEMNAHESARNHIDLL